MSFESLTINKLHDALVYAISVFLNIRSFWNNLNKPLLQSFTSLTTMKTITIKKYNNNKFKIDWLFIKYSHNNTSLLMAILSERNATNKKIVKEIDIKASFRRFNFAVIFDDIITV